MATPPIDYKATAEAALVAAQARATAPHSTPGLTAAMVGIGYALLHLSEVLAQPKITTSDKWMDWAKRMARGKGDD